MATSTVRLVKNLVQRGVRLGDHLAWRSRCLFPPPPPVPVLFDVANHFGFQAQAPVIRAMLQSRNILVTITSTWMAGEELVDLVSYYKIPPVLIRSVAELVQSDYRACVITDASKAYLWRIPTWVYLHHGSTTSNRDRPYFMELLDDGDCNVICCLSHTELEQGLVRYGESFLMQAAITGQPKLDELLIPGHSDREETLMNLGLDVGLKTVLLASHWAPGSLYRSGDLQHLKQFFSTSEVNLIVIGHGHLFGDCKKNGMDWEARLRSLFSGERMRVLPNLRDNRAVMRACDLLIADKSSIHVEYAVLERPMVLYMLPGELTSPGYLELLWNTAHLVESTEEIPRLVEKLLENPEVDLGARKAFLDHNLAFIGESTLRATRFIELVARTGKAPMASRGCSID